MKRKILSSILGCVIFTAVAFSLLVCVLLVEYFQNQTRTELARDLNQISAAINHNADPIAYLEALDKSGLMERMTLVSEAGTVLYDSRSDALQMENHLDREEIRMAAEDGYGSSVRYSDTLRRQTIYYAIRLENGNILRIADTQNSAVGILSSLSDFTSYFSFALLLTCIVFSLVGVRMTHQIVKPINELNLDVPEQSDIYPELQPLLQRMAHRSLSIQEYIRTINARHVEFDTITANMAEGLIVTSTEGTMLSINRSAEQIFGMQNALGRSILELSDDPAFQETLRTALRGKQARRRLEMDGKCYQLHVNPVFDSGHFTGLVALVPDITDQYLAEKNRREFTANVTHELKTPLTSIVGYAEIMKSGIADTKDWKDLVECIHKEGSRMIRLVEDILYLSRLDSGAVYGRPEETDLAALVEEIIVRLQPAAVQKSVRISFNSEALTMCCLRRMTEEMISNLIDNAIKYNHEGGSVAVSLRRDGQNALICVEDSGIGIAPADQPYVFERFFRADKSRSKATGGTGLGLSIVKHAVMYMDGSIDLESTPGKGTKITVRLPVRKA